MEPTKRYEFLVTITVDGVKREAGDVVDADAIAAGTLPNLIRCGQVREALDARAGEFSAFMEGKTSPEPDAEHAESSDEGDEADNDEDVETEGDEQPKKRKRRAHK